MKRIKSILAALLNNRAGILYIFLFALAIAVATFIENDFGTPAAQKWIYRATWFELLLVLFGGSILYNAITYRLWQRRMYAVFLFHIAILVILFGSLLTRMIGYEGMLGIREGTVQNEYLTREPFLHLTFEDEQGQLSGVEHSVLFSSLGPNRFKERYSIGEQKLELELLEFIPNARAEFTKTSDGPVYLKMVFPGARGRVEDYIAYGEQKRIGGVPINFSDTYAPGQVHIKMENGGFLIHNEEGMRFTVMATQEQTEIPQDSMYSELRFKALYEIGSIRFVVPEYSEGGSLHYLSEVPKMSGEGTHALHFVARSGNNQREFYVLGSEQSTTEGVAFGLASYSCRLSYGPLVRQLPFGIRLNDFEMERYPGTNSPASFASEVTVLDTERNKEFNYRIYMNHILNYRGFRFFQSSYDTDEMGTYLSVNHDFWGTWVSYLGYFLLTLGLIWSLISKNTRFYKLRKGGFAALILLLPLLGQAQNEPQYEYGAPSQLHAERLSKLLVQDIKGRFKPLHTFNREIMRKVHGSESFDGLNADQVVSAIWAAPPDWYGVPLIKLGRNEALKEQIGITASKAAYRDFFDREGRYILADAVDAASMKRDADKNALDKALIALDERVSIVNMLMSGSLYRIIPLAGDPNNRWLSERDFGDSGHTNFFQTYRRALHQGITHNNFSEANQLISDLDQYQRELSSTVIPSNGQRDVEILMNQLNVFNGLAKFYTLLGFLFLIFLFRHIATGSVNPWVMRILVGLAFLAFLYHTLGLAGRWYVAERAPWSNGYESMIYIAWTTVLAGFLFNRKSLGALTATFILSGVMLFIAHLSFLNPEITPLVPVLKSYWLTIHVSLEAGSYGFLLLGGLIGYLNLVLMLFLSNKRKERSLKTIRELTVLSEITITGGLVMLSIGTYLGGVWANESWGRYWGWDAKETWALVSILVYAFILHMRLIPRLSGLFAYNLATIVGFASVIMTYFGVNYYLSGLHSYAAGDPVPIPSWVYIAICVIALTALLAWRRHKRYA